MLRLTHISFSYEKEPVLKDISLNIPSGSFNVFVGASGSGKTTLLHIIAELLRPTSGMLEVDERIGMVFQNGALLPWFSTFENVCLPLKAMGESKAAVAKHAGAALKRVGLEEMKDRFPRELSGGQRQRVGLARALAVSPDLLLLDEPFSALDVNTSKKLREDLLSIWKELNVTVLMVSHSVDEAVELAQNIYALKDGKLHEPVQIGLDYPRDAESSEVAEYIRKVKRLL